MNKPKKKENQTEVRVKKINLITFKVSFSPLLKKYLLQCLYISDYFHMSYKKNSVQMVACKEMIFWYRSI